MEQRATLPATLPPREVAHVRTSPKKRKAFLEAYTKLRGIARAAKAIGVAHTTVLRWRQADPVFNAAVEEIKEQVTEEIEDAMITRAIGWDEPVLDKDGNHVGDRKKSSDLCLIFALKGARPDVYRERSEVHHTGTGFSLEINLGAPPAEPPTIDVMAQEVD